MASKFTRKFQEKLRSELKSRIKDYVIPDKEDWLEVDGKPVLPVDITLESAEKMILIEIESHRQDPSNNVAKVLYWLRKEKPSKEIVLVQLFSPFYKEHGIKKAVSEELGAILENECGASYRSVGFAPKVSSKEFDTVYRDPNGHTEEIGVLVEGTAKRLIELLFVK
jgi:hypothetical protein